MIDKSFAQAKQYRWLVETKPIMGHGFVVLACGCVFSFCDGVKY
jgi:hypothetical protein